MTTCHLTNPFLVHPLNETLVSSALHWTAAEWCKHLVLLQALCRHDQVHKFV